MNTSETCHSSKKKRTATTKEVSVQKQEANARRVKVGKYVYQGRPEWGGANGAIFPRPLVKGDPKICKRGASKGVIKKNYLYILK